MKRLRRLFAGLAGIFAAFAITSCQDAPDTAPTTALMRATIIYAGEGSILVVPSEADGSIPNADDVYSPGVSDAEIVDVDGNPLTAEDLSAGQVVELIYDGNIREIYPAGITCSEVRVVGRHPEGWEVPTDLSRFFPEPDPNDPFANMPSMGVEYSAGGAVGYTFSVRGNASWDENGEAVVVDSALPFDGHDRVPVITVQEGYAEAALSFSREPDSVTLRCWEWEDLAANGAGAEEIGIPLEGNTFSWPEERGKYLFAADAEWENGHVSYHFAADSRPFSLEMEEKIPLSAGEAAYTIVNRTGDTAEILLIPKLERLAKNEGTDSAEEADLCGYPRADAGEWKEVPLEMGFCGVPDTVNGRMEGSVPFSWWPGLEAGLHRLSFSCTCAGEEYWISCVFALTEG